MSDTSPRTIGALIALYERAVGFYATLIKVNAYHQPGVEAGKRAATAAINLQKKIIERLKGHKNQAHTVAQIAAGIGALDEIETIFKILRHLSANKDHGVKRSAGPTEFEATYSAQ